MAKVVQAKVARSLAAPSKTQGTTRLLDDEWIVVLIDDGTKESLLLSHVHERKRQFFVEGRALDQLRDLLSGTYED